MNGGNHGALSVRFTREGISPHERGKPEPLDEEHSLVGYIPA